MNDDREIEQVDVVTEIRECLERDAGRDRLRLRRVTELLPEPSRIWGLFRSPPSSDFTPDRLVDLLSPTRARALAAGAEPTSEELERWRLRWLATGWGDNPYSYWAYLTWVRHRDGAVWAVITLERSGVPVEVSGIYPSEHEAITALQQLGTLTPLGRAQLPESTVPGNKPLTQVALRFEDGPYEQLHVTRLAEGYYRLEDSPFLSDDAAYGDIIEVETDPDGVLRFARIVAPAGLRRLRTLTTGAFAFSSEWATLCDQIMAEGGNWEQISGGYLVISMPYDSSFDVEQALHAAIAGAHAHPTLDAIIREADVSGTLSEPSRAALLRWKRDTGTVPCAIGTVRSGDGSPARDGVAPTIQAAITPVTHPQRGTRYLASVCRLGLDEIAVGLYRDLVHARAALVERADVSWATPLDPSVQAMLERCVYGVAESDGAGERLNDGVAHLVATLYWQWSPMHARRDRLYLAPDRTGEKWFLWLSSSSDGAQVEAIFAAMPRAGADAVTAAQALLISAYRGEEEEFGKLGRPAMEVDPLALLQREHVIAACELLWPSDPLGSPE